ncbi:MAG: hypothetical protein EBS01_11280, partial [Verrucomicrobia bacterium]|nr:hypothetical protein [Verrucomicrobiota bacterium]
ICRGKYRERAQHHPKKRIKSAPKDQEGGTARFYRNTHNVTEGFFQTKASVNAIVNATPRIEVA